MPDLSIKVDVSPNLQKATEIAAAVTEMQELVPDYLQHEAAQITMHIAEVLLDLVRIE